MYIPPDAPAETDVPEGVASSSPSSPGGVRPRVLMLGERDVDDGPAKLLRQAFEVETVTDLPAALDRLRAGGFVGVYAATGDFLPLERGLVGQQADLVLNTIGEGVCIVGPGGHCLWQNHKMQAWPDEVRDEVIRTCGEALTLFAEQTQPPALGDTMGGPRSKRYATTAANGQFMEVVASPVIDDSGAVRQVAAVVWDATGTRRLQQKIDAIDKAGRELVRLESEAIRHLNMADRLKLLEETIIGYTRDLLHFDHFAIRLLDKKNEKLELVISEGLPDDALNVELFRGDHDGGHHGISGYVAATGRSYICADVDRDERYVTGLDGARSSLTVPLQLHDKVLGVFNIESHQPAAFTEDDRQFAEIFGRYVAMALNILDLMVFERVETRSKLADDVSSEAAGPLNDIASDAAALQEEFLGDESLRQRLASILSNVEVIRGSLKQAVRGPQTILGAKNIKPPAVADPTLRGARVMVVDDESNIRETIGSILRKYQVNVTIAGTGEEAIAHLDSPHSLPPDLIVSDIKMPDLSGYDVFAAARKLPQPPPVILMTGFGYDPNHCIVRASQEGLQAVLFKPFKVDQLLTEIRKALAHRVDTA
jgi:CheY-like chemotaxis protein